MRAALSWIWAWSNVIVAVGIVGVCLGWAWYEARRARYAADQDEIKREIAYWQRRNQRDREEIERLAAKLHRKRNLASGGAPRQGS